MQRCTCAGTTAQQALKKQKNRRFAGKGARILPLWTQEYWGGPYPTHQLPPSPGADRTPSNHRLKITWPRLRTPASAPPLGGGSSTWGARTTGPQRRPEPRGPAEAKRQGAGPKGGPGREAERGANQNIVSQEAALPSALSQFSADSTIRPTYGESAGGNICLERSSEAQMLLLLLYAGCAFTTCVCTCVCVCPNPKTTEKPACRRGPRIFLHVGESLRSAGATESLCVTKNRKRINPLPCMSL